jgi:putative membrane protein
VSSPVETQPERTALSWQRTGLGVLGLAGLLGHDAVRRGQPVLLLVAGGTALLGLGVLGGLAPLRYRRLRGGPMPGAGAATRLVAAATATVVLACLAAAVAVLTPR